MTTWGKKDGPLRKLKIFTKIYATSRFMCQKNHKNYVQIQYFLKINIPREKSVIQFFSRIKIFFLEIYVISALPIHWIQCVSDVRGS